MKNVKKRRATPPRRMPLNYKNARISPLRIAGCYYNPEDPHLFVLDLRGLNRGSVLPSSTINLGHPLGWRVAGGILMALGGMILVGFLLTQSFLLLFAGVSFLLLNLLVL